MYYIRNLCGISGDEIGQFIGNIIFLFQLFLGFFA